MTGLCGNSTQGYGRRTEIQILRYVHITFLAGYHWPMRPLLLPRCDCCAG